MKIKKLLFLLLFSSLGLILFTPNTVNASVGDTFQDISNGFYYKVLTEDDIQGNTVEVTKYTGGKTEVEIPENVKNNDIEYKVTSIGKFVFHFDNNPNVTYVKIADTISNIDINAFFLAENLKKVDISQNSKLEIIGEGAFSNCKNLESIYFPETLTTIQMSAFSECEKLSNVILPDSLTTLGRSAFYGCLALKSITIPEKIVELNQNFQECRNLETITIKGELTSLGHYTFSECQNLTEIKFEKPYTMTYIGNSLFYNCEKLNIKEFHILEGVTSIGNNAFYNCKLLEVITIPNTVEKIDARALAGCSSLKKIVVLNEECVIGKDILLNCSNALVVYGFVNSAIQEYIEGTTYTFKEIYEVNNNLNNITNDGLNYAHKDFGNYVTTLTANVGYELPQNIRIKVNEYDLSLNDYEYDSKSGNLKIYANKIDGSIEIEAVGEKIIKVSFDGNGGSFSDGSKIIEYDNIKECDFSSLAIPIRDEYKFIGYFTEEGTSIDNIMNSEAGIKEDIIFYAQWEKIYTYTFIMGKSQTFISNQIDEYSFKIDGDYKLFSKLIISNLNLEKDIDFKVTEGSTIITFTKTGLEKLNTLKVGNYDVIVKYSNDKEVTGNLIIAADTTIEDTNGESGIGNTHIDNTDKDRTNSGNNPQTSDNVMLFVIILGISIIGVIATTKIGKKLKNN